MQEWVRFYADYRIKQHASPWVLGTALSFQFRPFGYTIGAVYLLR